MIDYALKNKSDNTGDAIDFQHAIQQYYNGLGTVAMVDVKDFKNLDDQVINNKSVNSKSTIEVSEFSMKRANSRLWTFMGASLQAVDFVANAGLFPEVGAGPRGPYKYNLEDYEVPLFKYDPRVRQRG